MLMKHTCELVFESRLEFVFVFSFLIVKKCDLPVSAKGIYITILKSACDRFLYKKYQL